MFLAIGESFTGYRKQGQDKLIIDYHLRNYAWAFDRVYVFSYVNERLKPFANVTVLPNKWRLHRCLYSLLAPVLYRKELRSCSVLRGLQLTGGIPCAVAKIFYRIPFVINYGYFYREIARMEKHGLASFLYQIVEQPLLTLANRVIVPANYIRKAISNSFPARKFFFLPNGVDANAFIPRKNSNHRTNSFTLLFVGRLEVQKNLSLLITALAQIKQEKIVLVLVGEGSLHKQLANLAQKAQVKVKFIGALSHDKLPDYYQQADIFILPSLTEGQPKSLLEAMGCGLPVIASDIPAHREIITDGQNGILCQNTVSSLARVIKRLIADSGLRRRLGSAARVTVIKSFDKKMLNKQEIELLKEVAYER